MILPHGRTWGPAAQLHYHRDEAITMTCNNEIELNFSGYPPQSFWEMNNENDEQNPSSFQN